MAAFIFKDSLSKPRFRSDLARPIDALKLFPKEQWHSLSFIGAAGLEALHAGIDATEYEIFHNREQMLRAQDFAVYHREGEPMTIAFIALGVSVATSVYSIVMANKMKAPDNLNRTQESASNRIQGRENEARLNQRVENSYGQIRNFFTQMAMPYIRCEDNQQVEYSYMSAGKGRYLIEDVRDNRTSATQLAEWSMKAYRPFESPNNGQPYLEIGPQFTQKIFTTFKSDELDREELDPPNELEISTDWTLTGSGGDGVLTATNTEIDLRDFFTGGQVIDLSALAVTEKIGEVLLGYRYDDFPNLSEYITGLVDTYSLTAFDGVYEVESVSENTITLTIPDSEAGKWTGLADASPIKEMFELSGGELIKSVGSYDYYVVGDGDGEDSVGASINPIKTEYKTQISTSFDGTIGPFEVENNSSIIQYNLYSDALLKDKGKNDTQSLTVSGEATVRQLDETGKPTGEFRVYDWSLSSNGKNRRKQACKSFDIQKPYPRCSIEFRRTSNRDFEFNGTVRDIVEITELYFHRDDGMSHFGDKTTLQFRRTQTTYGIGKSSKVSALTTSELLIDGTYKPTRFFDEIICDAAADVTFGRRSPATVAQMRDELKRARLELIDYFGREDVAYFDYCIDSENITFEAFVKMVASSVFCTPYLKSTLRFSPDIAQPIDSMIFGSANKLVGEESLKYSFDDLQSKKYDCVEIKWRNPANLDAQEAFFVPSQGSNPKTIELNGVRDYAIAQVHGWREWNRIKYQRYSYECLVGLEGTQLIPNQRIGIVNNCCAESLDGYVRAWDGGVNILLSQEADLSSGGYKITLQNPQGGVGIFDVSQGVDLKHVVLGRAPEFIVNASMKENLTVYRISKEADLEVDSYAIQEPELTTNGIKIKAVNYSSEIYEKDKTFW